MIVKLTRVIMLAPIVAGVTVATWARRRTTDPVASAAGADTNGTIGGRPLLLAAISWVLVAGVAYLGVVLLGV